jgi:hypothetical protein
MGTKKGQRRKTARRAYEPKKKELSRARGFGQVNPFASNALDNLKKLKGGKK